MSNKLLPLFLFLLLVLSTNLPALAFQQTIVVSPVVGQPTASGQALLAAVNQINDAAWGKRYLVKVEAGVYDLEANSLLMKPFVDIEGSGRKLTLIRGKGRPISSGQFTGVIHGSDNAELRELAVQALGGPGEEVAIALFNEYATTFRDLDISVSGGTSCWGLRSLASTPTIKDLAISVNCSFYSAGIAARSSSRPVIEDTQIRSQGSGSETGNVGVFLDPGSMPYRFRGVRITVGDSNAPGTGILLANSGTGGWFEIVDTSINTKGGRGIHSEVYLSLKIRHSNIVGCRIGINVPGSWLFVHSSLVDGSEATILSSGAIYVGASQLDGGPLYGSTQTCAGVYDENFTFFANQCP